mmetsp:Transcript_27865/g.33843  ORF Transcript_27865/g.33843 Transcript_27865/m.33843 type:complete len:239 (+) Transcript_27865:916-1632(+)
MTSRGYRVPLSHLHSPQSQCFFDNCHQILSTCHLDRHLLDPSHVHSFIAIRHQPHNIAVAQQVITFLAMDFIKRHHHLISHEIICNSPESSHHRVCFPGACLSVAQEGSTASALQSPVNYRLHPGIVHLFVRTLCPPNRVEPELPMCHFKPPPTPGQPTIVTNHTPPHRVAAHRVRLTLLDFKREQRPLSDTNAKEPFRVVVLHRLLMKAIRDDGRKAALPGHGLLHNLLQILIRDVD